MEERNNSLYNNGSPVICVEAGLHLPEYRFATINVQIGISLKAYLLGNGSEGFKRSVRHCMSLLLSPPFDGMERTVLSIPVNSVHVLRYQMSRSREVPDHLITNLGSVFLESCWRAMRGEDPVGSASDGIRCTHSKLYVRWMSGEDSYLLLRIDVPSDVTRFRVDAYADRLSRHLRTKLSDAGRAPMRFSCPEGGVSIGPGVLYANGRVANVGVAKVMGELERLISQVRNDLHE